MFISVYTWDGRRETRNVNPLFDELSETLGLDLKS